MLGNPIVIMHPDSFADCLRSSVSKQTSHARNENRKSEETNTSCVIIYQYICKNDRPLLSKALPDLC